jgi:hypothetical protein
MGGSGTINPQTGLPEFFKIGNPFKPVQRAIGQTNPFNPGSAAGKAIGSIPGVKEAQNLGTQVFQPLEKAVVQPASRGLASFDKAVGNAIPGGWGTVGSIALSAMGAPVPLQVAYGAARGSGVMRKGGNFNLQGAMIGGATAYATAKLGDYLRAAAPGAEGASNMATLPESAVDLSSGVNAATGEVGSGLAGNASGMLVDPTAVTSSNTAALNSLSASMEAGAGSGLQVAPPPSVFSQLASGNISDAASQIGSNIASGANSAYDSSVAGLKSLGTDIASAADKYTTPSTYSEMIDKGLSNASQTGSGIKNLITGPAGVSKAASTLSGVNPVAMSGMALYGETSLSDLDAQRDFLKQQQAAGNIAQAEYDAAMAEINRQRDYAAGVVKDSPFSTNPDRDVSIGETFYGRGGSEDTLYGRGDTGTTLYAMGGSIDDEYGMDEARGMMQGNLQKGLFGRGYAAGGQIDMGNGYNPFSNLPPMSGPLGAVRQDMTTFDPNFNKPNFDAARNLINSTNTTTEQDMMGGNRNGVSGGLSGILSGFGGITHPINASTLNATPQPLGGLNQQVPTGPIFNSSTYQSTGMGPNSGASSSTYPGGYGGGGGSGGAFPLEGQYGIVKMAAGGMTPRFLSGGGDGMSDDIPATINNNQPARLADGEFVVPADVVSHIGNGSSKAGAKQLYSMMNKVRKARTGNPKQGKQINPSKYLPA